MAAAASVARHLLNEASSGTTPTTAADDQGSNDLTIDYSSGDAVWTSIPAGNGLDYTATVLTANTAIMTLSDISTNGNIGSSFPSGTKELSYIIVCDIDVGHNSGPRLIQIGSDGGDGDFAIATRPTNWLFRWSKEVGGSDIVYPVPSGSYGTGVVVVHVIINSAETTAADRIKVYYDKVLQTASSGSVTLDETVDFGNTSYNFSLGNRETLDRNINGKIYNSELFTGVMTFTEVEDSYDALILDNDAGWAPGGETVEIPLGAMTLSGKVPTIQATNDKTASIPAGALSLTGFTPTAQAGLDIDVAVPAGSMAITGQVPAIINNVDTAIPLGSLTLTGFNPTIQAGGNVTTDIPAGSMSVDGKIPTVTATDNKTVEIPAGSLSIGTFAPDVIVTDNKAVEVPAGTMTLTGFQPVADASDDKDVTIPVGSILLSGLSPTVAFGPFSTNVPVGTLTLTGFLPTIITVASPDSATSVVGTIDPLGASMRGTIDNSGVAVGGRMYESVMVSGTITESTTSTRGKIDENGLSVKGTI